MNVSILNLMPIYNKLCCLIIYSLILIFSPWAQAETKADLITLESISVQLRYLHQFQFAGFYAAIEQGYYKDVGLDVTLIEAKLGKPTVAEVLAGNAQYGQTQTDLLYAYLQGKPVVALAPIFQHSPTALIVRADSNIYSPHDLIGKRVMLQMGDNSINILAMLQNEGVELSDIKVVKQSYVIDELVNKTVDAMGVYIINRPFLLSKAGINSRIINPINYGIDFYGDTLFTTKNEVNNHPERVERFLQATLRGWQYAMDHTDEIIDLIIKQYHSQESREHLTFEALTIKKLMLPNLVEIGHTNPGRWYRMADILVEQGKAPTNYSLDGFIYTPNKPWYNQYWIRYLSITLLLLLVVTACFLYYWQLSKRLNRVISERNSAEKNNLRLGHVLEQSSNEIYIFDVKTLHFLQVNQGARQNLGYSMKELKKLTPVNIKPEYTQQDFSEFVRPLQQGKQNQLIFETIHQRKNGSCYPVEVRLQIYNVPDNPVYYAIINDITDRKKIDKELLEKNTELEQFIYMISHDLKSPLVTVKTFLSYLTADIDKSDSARIAEDINFMASATNKMGILLDDLLEFSRVGRQSKNIKPISFKQLIADVLKLTAGSISKNKINIQVDDIDLTLQGDHYELTQIWQNLVENSIKYMGKQSNPIIEIGIHQINEKTIFYVRDNGIGIEPQYNEKIFDIFEQLNPSVDGSGLGLALIKRIVELYQGTIYIESKGLEQGACFLFTLPEAINSHDY
ncbi:MAG: ABC transporter substrate-binding protein [Methylococcales bacterium]